MPPVFDTNHPWVLTFGLLGNIISILVYFAPLPTFIRIHRIKSTLGFQSLPYVLTLFSGMLWIFYAFLKTDAILLISVNSIGCVIETIYIVIFLIYASKDARKQTLTLVGSFNVVLFAAIFLFTMFTEKGAYRVQVVGWICVATAVCVFAAPLSIVFQVVRTKSVEFMPFNLSFTLTLSAVLWFAYGLLKRDIYVTVPNVLGFVLGILQMVLYGIYRSPPKKGVKEVLVVEMEKKAAAEHVINVTTNGGPAQVYRPADAKTTTAVTEENGGPAQVLVVEMEKKAAPEHVIIENDKNENKFADEEKERGDEENNKTIPDGNDHQCHTQQLNATHDSALLIVCSA